MTITASQVNELRKKTGVSMMACKKALVEAEGIEEKAIEILRKKGESKAQSKSDRTTNEGIIQFYEENNKVAIVAINCETDFVARNDELINTAKEIAQKSLQESEDVAKNFADTKLKELFNKLGENLQLTTLKIISGATTGTYIHSNNKLAAVVVLDGSDSETARDIAMHVTAMNPAVINPSEISEELVTKEKEIWAEQLKNENKPANIIEKIMTGKERKFREESALIKQAFVKDPEKTVEQLLNGVKIISFERFSV